jgi:hypothetical protein
MSTANEYLVKEASEYVGVKETGPNQGPDVEMFQRAVDGKASKESWCMCFVQYCIHQVEQQLGIRSNVFNSEHCLTVWRNTIHDLHRAHPAPGYIAIWQHYDEFGKATSNGHTGIVTEVLDADRFATVEGNTSDSSSVDRNGDGVYRKTRYLKTHGTMQLVGFIDPFPGIVVVEG